MRQAPGITDKGRLERFGKLIHETTGIKLPPSKHLMIESRLRKRIIALEMPDLDTYLRWFFDSDVLDSELPELVDLLTTNKTDFFREDAHYRILADRLVPEALDRGQRGRAVPFRFWSAASSTGEEAWSAAMVLARAAERDPRLDWAIIGTDISRRVLSVARQAVYSSEELAPVPPDMRSDYVMAGRPGSAKRGRIVPELRARVRFSQLNLIETPYGIDDRLDVVFLRNVLIYFEPDAQHRVICAAASRLRIGGYLVVGHSESMTVRVSTLAQIAPGVFRKEGGA